MARPVFFVEEGRERKWVPSGGGVEMGRLAAPPIVRHPISPMPPDGTHVLSLTTGRGEQGRRLRGGESRGREGGDAAPGRGVHSFLRG